MRIPFSIKFRPQIESGEYKVETRDGKPVRIICWDRKSEDGDSIIALVDDGARELGYSFKNTGRFMNSGKDNGADLFIITHEPELTEFEKEVAGWMETAKDEHITNEMIVDAADNLMFIARKQFIKEAEEKATNEGYDIEDAVAFNEGFKTAKEIYSKSEAKPSKRLPTIEEWKCLIDNCKWEWDDARKGQVVTAKNGNSIFLPAAGYRYDNYLYNVGSNGGYWSSSPYMDYPGFAYGVYFYPSNVTCGDDARYYGFSVRPVSDTPQEGFVDMGNNLFWAVENEKGHFAYDEAMKLFNSYKYE